MRVFLGVGFVLLVVLVAAADDDDKKPDTLKTQFDALLKEYGEVQKAFLKAVQAVEDPKERQKIMKDEAPKLDIVLGKLVELADKNAKHPSAIDALILAVQNPFTARAGGTSRKKALKLIERDHLTSDKLGPLCRRLGGIDGQNDKFLRVLVDKNPSKSVQAEACLALMQSLAQRAEIVNRMKEDEDLAKQLEESVGKESTDALKKADPAKLTEESEKLTKLFSEKYVGEMQTERLVGLCQQLSFSPSKANETLLRKIAESDAVEVKGVAILCLGQMIKEDAGQKAEKDEKATEARYQESEKLLQQAADKYADVKFGRRGTVGEKAKGDLFEVKNLRVGKAAPDVEGEDQDSKKFKLSDYKGKVVLLDFWSQF